MDMAREPLGIAFWKRKLTDERHVHAAIVREKDMIIRERDTKIRDQADRIRALELEVHGLKEINKFMDQKLFPPLESIRQTAAIYPPPARPALPAIGYEQQGVNRQDTFVVSNGQATGFDGHNISQDHLRDQQEQRPGRSWTPNVQGGQNSGQPTVQASATGHHHQSGSITSAMTPSPTDHHDQERDFSSRSRLYHRNEQDEDDDMPPPHLPMRQDLDDDEEHRMAHLHMANGGYNPAEYDDHHGAMEHDEHANDDIDFPEDDEEEEQAQPAPVARKRSRPPAKKPTSGGNRKQANKKKSDSSKDKRKQPAAKAKASPSKSRRTASSNRSSTVESELDAELDAEAPEQQPDSTAATTSSAGRKRKPTKRFDSGSQEASDKRRSAGNKKSRTSEPEREKDQQEEDEANETSDDNEGPPALAINSVNDDSIEEDDEPAAGGDDGDHANAEASAFKPDATMAHMVRNSFDQYMCRHRRCVSSTSVFNNRRRAGEHNRRHINESKMPFQCEACGIGYEEQAKLDAHGPRCIFAEKGNAENGVDEEAGGDTASEV